MSDQRLRVAVYNLYWSTYGGGEQVAGAIAAALADEHEVVLLGPEPVDVATTRSRLGLDLGNCDYQRVVDDDGASAASAGFDVFVNSTYRSSAVNRAPVGLYYVHFPEPPGTRGQRVWRTCCRLAGSATSRVQVGPLRRIHAALERRSRRTGWALSYTRFLANSQFTADWTTRLWRVPSEVLYPPVQPEVQPGAKTHLIAGLGRFFDPKFGHCKKQLDLLHAFVEFSRTDPAGWRLALVGGADASSRDYALAVKRAAVDRPVLVHLNAPRSVVHDTLATAAIFWHGAGFGEDPEIHPERFEHFGIAVVEAMAAGAVPVVFGAAGPEEIVRDGVDGLHWHTLEELVQQTRRLIADGAMLAAMSESARRRAEEFSTRMFAEKVRALVR